MVDFNLIFNQKDIGKQELEFSFCISYILDFPFYI